MISEGAHHALAERQLSAYARNSANHQHGNRKQADTSVGLGPKPFPCPLLQKEMQKAFMCTQMGAHSPATPHEGGGSQGLGSAGSLAAVRAFWPSSLLLSHCVSAFHSRHHSPVEFCSWLVSTKAQAQYWALSRDTHLPKQNKPPFLGL